MAGRVRLTAFDTETFLISPGQLCPKLVCGSFAYAQAGTFVEDAQGALDLIAEELCTGPERRIIIGQNVAFDMGVVCAEAPYLIPRVFDAYEDGRIRDTMIRAQLRDIAMGDFSLETRPRFYTDKLGNRVQIRYNLDALAQRFLDKVLVKDNAIRLMFGTLHGKPVSEWPEKFVRYARQDAEVTLELFLHQQSFFSVEEGEEEPGQMPTEVEQCCAAFALHLASAWGLRTNEKRVYELRDRTMDAIRKIHEKLKGFGIFRADGTKNMTVVRELVEAAYEGSPPRTAGGGIATDKDTLKGSNNEALMLMATLSGHDKIMSTYVPMLMQGIKVPINTRFHVLVESNRTSASEPNTQNAPREGDVRGCFEPRRGFVFFSCDFDTQELRSLAQVCMLLLGWSDMAEALKRNEELHLAFAADLMQIPYEEAYYRYKEGDKEVGKQRQFAKVANFGFPGGLGADTFVEYAKNFGIFITADFAKELRDAWFRRWREMKDYFRLVNEQVGRYGGTGQITLPMSGFVRGGIGFTQAANGYFQGHTAWGVKRAAWSISKEMYAVKDSPLYGSRVSNYIHDELFGEMPETKAAEAAKRVQKVMQSTMQACLPDVPAACTAVLMRRWYKGAKPVYVNGLLVPSKPIDQEGRTVWVHDTSEQ